MGTYDCVLTRIEKHRYCVLKFEGDILKRIGIPGRYYYYYYYKYNIKY